MLIRRIRHTLEMSMEERRSGRLILSPPLSERAYSVGVQTLRLTPDRDWLNPGERIVPDEETTEYEIAVDSERHLNGRANCLYDGLREAGVEVVLGDSVRYE